MADLKALLEGVGRELQDDFERHTILKLDSVVLSLNSSVGEIFLNALHTDEKIQQGVVKLEEDKLKAFEAIKEYMDALYGVRLCIHVKNKRLC
ncbi:hypothetical protein GCK32_000504 [Trichostrongylus colubriformis]|uniref:Uncharacterized protein n=1 Tax=Trichostrongylus colubriformis TaxID=6319 RepID=A0AAN8INS5_TRICO